MKKEEYYKVYQTWSDMKYKCNNPNARAYKTFGGRGISYAPEWESYEAFRKDMLPSYLEALEKGIETRRLTLGRLNKDGDFSPSNCVWTTVGENDKLLFAEKYNFLVAQKDGEEKRVFPSLANFSSHYKIARSGAIKALHNGSNCVKDIVFMKITAEEYTKSLKDRSFLNTLPISYDKEKYSKNKIKIQSTKN